MTASVFKFSKANFGHDNPYRVHKANLLGITKVTGFKLEARFNIISYYSSWQVAVHVINEDKYPGHWTLWDFPANITAALAEKLLERGVDYAAIELDYSNTETDSMPVRASGTECADFELYYVTSDKDHLTRSDTLYGRILPAIEFELTKPALKDETVPFHECIKANIGQPLDPLSAAISAAYSILADEERRSILKQRRPDETNSLHVQFVQVVMRLLAAFAAEFPFLDGGVVIRDFSRRIEFLQ